MQPDRAPPLAQKNEVHVRPPREGLRKTRTTIQVRLHSAPSSRDHADPRNARRDRGRKTGMRSLSLANCTAPPTHTGVEVEGVRPAVHPGCGRVIIPDKAYRHESQSPRRAQSSQPGLSITLQVMLIRVELSSPGYKYLKSRARSRMAIPQIHPASSSFPQ